jgi:CRISPR-associated protein Csm3
LGKVPLANNNKRKLEAGGVSDAEEIVRLFGIGVDQREAADTNDHLFRIGPSRLVIRDCHADQETITWWKTLDTDLLYTEYKSENGINRITSAANPRFVERVAAGSRFDFEMVYSLFDIRNDGNYLEEAADDLDNLRMAMLMLEHNFLGKSGSRGYGRIKFGFDEPVWVTTKDYQEGSEAVQKAAKPAAEFNKLTPTSALVISIPENL